ncbi:helix-turn-helix domain-containing protein [uncultured Paraglaciecola sp.]|uniref:helix-turn-helix domain-containing protein n=1 Tax=uncultured Paraglaciecola sp. TaxID=1765024 RepID=UPI0026265E38|nr:helix-turn-helix domain-containing protein [uncultured Paraglaciecola sp.]
MKQTDQVLAHLKRYGTITQAEAIAEYNIWRLAARICELREQGNNIHTRMIKGASGRSSGLYSLGKAKRRAA